MNVTYGPVELKKFLEEAAKSVSGSFSFGLLFSCFWNLFIHLYH